MSKEIKIPAVGESVSSGVISTWHKKDGDQVSSGDVLLTLDTDKISTELTADVDGVLHIEVEEGEEVKIGAVVGRIEEGEGAQSSEEKETSDDEESEEESEDEKKSESTKEDQEKKSERPADKEKSESPDGGSETSREDSPPPPPKEESAEKEKSTGTESSSPGERSDRVTRKPLSPLRRKIAEQLVAAQQNAAILTTFNECDMSEVMALRKRIQDEFQSRHGVKLGFMSFFIKAAVSALKAVPAINGRLEGNDFVQNHYYDVGVAVGTERGLIVPVIRDADQKSFAEIEADILEYAGKARDGKITYDDLKGGVFTISNGGIYGSLLSTPILNPPQSGILGMHKIQERPMAVNGQVVIRPMMYLALSYDHRVVDGKEAVTFLIRVKECIEEPTRLLVEA